MRRPIDNGRFASVLAGRVFARGFVAEGVRSAPMNRQTRLVARLLAIGVIIAGAAVLLPHVLDGLQILLRALRHNWWLVVLVGLAVWVLLALGKKR